MERLFFLLYVNELEAHVGDGELAQFVDVTSKILLDRRTAELAAQCNITAISDCCKDNYLKVNTNKAGLITFERNNKKRMIDPLLNYEPQIISLQAKLNTACGLRSLRDAVHLTCIQPIIANGIMFWGSSPKVVNIFKCQKHILRCILRLSPRTSCRECFVHKILTIPSLYIFWS